MGSREPCGAARVLVDGSQFGPNAAQDCRHSRR